MKFTLGAVLGFILGIAVLMIGLKGRFPRQSHSLVYAGEKTLKKAGSPNVDFFKLTELDDVFLLCSRDQLGITFAIARTRESFPSAMIWLDKEGPVQVAAMNSASSTVTVTRSKEGPGPFDKLSISTPQEGDINKVFVDNGIDGTFDKTMTIGAIPKPK